MTKIPYTPLYALYSDHNMYPLNIITSHLFILSLIPDM